MSGSVLFDVPGPRAKATYRIVAVVGVLLLALALFVVIRGLANPNNNQFTAEKWAPFLEPATWTAFLLPGLLSTLKAAGLAILLSAILGTLLGLGRLSDVAPIRIVAGVFVEFFRSVPVLMLMLFFYYLAIYFLQIQGSGSAFFGVVAGLTIYNSAVIAELIRSGVHSLPKGQREAGLAVGLTTTQTMFSVLLPQAITAMLPALVSQLVVILKDTALGYIISYPDLLRSGQTLASGLGNLIPALIIMAAMFIAINWTLTSVANRIENRLRSKGETVVTLDLRTADV